MKVGTKSLLWGVHQVLWHPLTVYRAWVSKYGRPTWRELVCIVIHDWGYAGAADMDGEDGVRHPELGARLAERLFDRDHYHLVLYHSRHYVQQANAENFAMYGEDAAEVVPSRLCWADKLSILYEPEWFYLLRARLSGELREYRENAARAGFVPLSASDSEWFQWIRAKFVKLAQSMDAAVVPHAPVRRPPTRSA